ncbi:uncharacterized protein LOC130655560 [Hydractinia symbiolongicarpus]|uniref:uncharacterized protein LOC130655560 n=1 Tax=Hydractinia symbiolongicarpus TaxID=13093 RepID=UPI002550C54A|nr:uncharacterized protein LOC130655560 [Hydractinia symbiolongicarpus]
MTKTLILIEEDYISTNQPSLIMTSSNILSVSSPAHNASSVLNKVTIDVFDGNKEAHPSQSTNYKSQHLTATNTIHTQQSSAYNVFITIAPGIEIKASDREISFVSSINKNEILFHSSNASEISSQNDSVSKNQEIVNTTSNATSPMYMDLIFDDVYNENYNDSKLEMEEGMNKTQNKVEDLKANNITQEILDDLLQKSSDIVPADANVTSNFIDTGVNKTLMDELVETFNNHFEGVTPTLLSPASITQTEVFSTTQPTTRAQPIFRGLKPYLIVGNVMGA